jgi:endoglucanase
MEKYLKNLTRLYGVSGRESAVADYMADEFMDLGYVPKVDNMTNVTGGDAKNPTMIFAHTDEIGMMVQRIDPSGIIFFKKIGGFFNAAICNQAVDIPVKKDVIRGIIGLKPPHLMEDAEYNAIPKTQTLHVDIGATSDKEVLDTGIKVGTPIYFPRTYETRGTRVLANALDDRAGCAVMLHALDGLDSDNVVAVGTVQEEVGVRGARTSVMGHNPRAAIVLDVTFDSTQPGIQPHQCTTKIGQGPVVSISSRGMETCPKMLDTIERVADKENIKVQYEVTSSGGTDADIVHISEGGVPTALISIPNRYMHSPVEVSDLGDMKEASRLVAALVRAIDKW